MTLAETRKRILAQAEEEIGRLKEQFRLQAGQALEALANSDKQLVLPKDQMARLTHNLRVTQVENAEGIPTFYIEPHSGDRLSVAESGLARPRYTTSQIWEEPNDDVNLQLEAVNEPLRPASPRRVLIAVAPESRNTPLSVKTFDIPYTTALQMKFDAQLSRGK